MIDASVQSTVHVRAVALGIGTAVLAGRTARFVTVNGDALHRSRTGLVRDHVRRAERKEEAER